MSTSYFRQLWIVPVVFVVAVVASSAAARAQDCGYGSYGYGAVGTYSSSGFGLGLGTYGWSDSYYPSYVYGHTRYRSYRSTVPYRRYYGYPGGYAPYVPFFSRGWSSWGSCGW